MESSIKVIEFPGKTGSRKVVADKRPLAQNVRCLDDVKQKIVRDWDRGQSVADIANVYRGLGVQAIEAIIWQHRARHASFPGTPQPGAVMPMRRAA